MSKRHSVHKEVEEDDHGFNLNNLKVPIHVSHVKPGNTLCTNDEIVILQNGSTTIELRLPPKFQPKQIPWRDGLLRDIAWCPDLGVFILLTQKAVFAFNPKPLIAPPPPISATNNNDTQLKIKTYSKIQPYDDKSAFWRCTCVGRTLFISYSGLGTVIDEYTLEPTSCKFINRWLPPKTCGSHEGIWSIRHHPELGQLGMTIMDAQTNQWRFELRNHKDFSPIYRTVLPITHGDCETSPLAEGAWLVVNSCGIRLVQLNEKKLKAAVEYERELKNAIIVGDDYFAVRTKNTLEVHSIKKEDEEL